MSEVDTDLIRALERSRELGFLGPGAVEAHVVNARRFVECVPTDTVRALDIGAGGGVPGLCLARWFPSVEWNLLDSNLRRCRFLREAIDALGLSNAAVVEGRAEELARQADLRHSFDLVTARSFGAPAVTAECATGFLVSGGLLVVSEPPDAPDRWDAAGLSQLGMSLVESDYQGVAIIRQDEPSADRWPRRTGIPSKRPIF